MDGSAVTEDSSARHVRYSRRRGRRPRRPATGASTRYSRHTRHTRHDFAVPVKLWVALCVAVGVFFSAAPGFTWVLTLLSFAYVATQRKGRILVGCAAFYGVLSLLLILIREQGLTMWLFSEYHVFLFWVMTGVFAVSWDLITTPPGRICAFLSRLRAPAGAIVAVLVLFRFFPTLRAELRAVRESLHNRGLTTARRLALHPLAYFEYLLIPLLMRCLRTADQLAVSAVARGIEAPGIRSSYDEDSLRPRDAACAALVSVCLVGFLIVGKIG